jgi:hypothetical protein
MPSPVCYLVALSLLLSASLCESKWQLRGYRIGNNHLNGVLRRDGIERSLYVQSTDDGSESAYETSTEEPSSDDDDNVDRATMTPTSESSEILEESMPEPSRCPTPKLLAGKGQTPEPSNVSNLDPIFTSTAEPTATIQPLEASSTIQPTDGSSLEDTVGFAQGDQTFDSVSPSPTRLITGEPTTTKFPLQTSTPQPSDDSANERAPLTSQDTLEPTISFTSAPTALDLFPTSSPELISASAEDETLEPTQALLPSPSPFATFEPTGVLSSTEERTPVSTLDPSSTLAPDAFTEPPDDETPESTGIPSLGPTPLSMIEFADADPASSETAEPSPAASPAPVILSEESETLEPTTWSSIGSTIEATEENMQMNTDNDILSESTEDDVPTGLPTTLLSSMPSEVPSDVPSDTPSDVPSDTPSDVPSDVPSSEVLQELLSQGGETVFPSETQPSDY